MLRPLANQGRANEHAAWRLAVGLGAQVVDQVRACRRTLKVDASSAAHTCGWLQPPTRVLQPLAPTVAGLPPEADPSSWSNVSVQNRDLQQQQRRYGRHLQLFKGSVSGCKLVGRLG